MTSIALYLSGGFLILGSVLVLISAIGMLRFPDLFTRIHASSVATTFGAICIIVGLIFYNGSDAVFFKLALILLFLLFTGPTSIYALARAAIEAGIKPKISTHNNTEPLHHSQNNKTKREDAP
ncbi:monovalent cation/H(+) antiporter subunit G [Dasania marina]|uniref:monovalent cation/H(+) antiporter subunit G n=1 Tax=Dasania marina TaxID=471499 RepID=UPI0003823D63|nr:monovalent cation/H(+) antiporter subunit G [Dasania marina]